MKSDILLRCLSLFINRKLKVIDAKKMHNGNMLLSLGMHNTSENSYLIKVVKI